MQIILRRVSTCMAWPQRLLNVHMYSTVTPRLTALFLCVFVLLQADPGAGDAARLLLFLWLWKTQCRNCSLSSGQVGEHKPVTLLGGLLKTTSPTYEARWSKDFSFSLPRYKEPIISHRRATHQRIGKIHTARVRRAIHKLLLCLLTGEFLLVYSISFYYRQTCAPRA